MNPQADNTAANLARLINGVYGVKILFIDKNSALFFMGEKNLKLAVRVNANPTSVEDISVKTTLGQEVKYCLLSTPLYLTENVSALIDQVK